MSTDKTNDKDNGINTSQKRNNEDNDSPDSSGPYSRNSRRSRDRTPKHKSRIDKEKSSSKKKKRDRSVTSKRDRSRTKSPNRQRHHHRDRSREVRNSRDDRRRDERHNKKDWKSSRRDRSPPFSRRRSNRRSRKRKTSSSVSSDDEINNLKHSATLSGLLMKKEEKKPKSRKRKRKASSSSSSSSEDTKDDKPITSKGAVVIEAPQQPVHFQAPYMNHQFGFAVQPMPPPLMSGYMPNVSISSRLPPPPMAPNLQQSNFYGLPPAPPVPPTLNPATRIQPPLPPMGPLLPQPPLPPALPKVPKPPSILNKAPRDVNNVGDWGSGSVNKYDILGQVGEGTYGQVYKARDASGGPVALKKVRLDNEREGFPITAVREIKILRQLNHTNVVQLLDIVTDQSSAADLRANNANFYLVFEYVDHDLTGLLEAAHNKLIPDFQPSQIAVMFKQLLSGMEYCHSKKFLHRDIKCSNILVNNKGELKIADWGLARLYHDDQERLYTNRVITLWYRPPELLMGAEHYGPSVDVWSVGCILAEFFTKKAIFMGQHESEQLLLISSLCGTPSPEVWPDVINMPLYRTMKPKKPEFRKVKTEYSQIMPSGAVDLLDKMLLLDPKKRLSASEALRHQWIRHIDPSKVPPLQLPVGQDCHELWSKKQKKERKSGIVHAGTLQTRPVDVNLPSREPARRSDSGDGSYNQAWQNFTALIHSHTQSNDPSNYKKAQDFLTSLSEANCQAIVNQLASQGQMAPGLFNTGKETLLVLAAKIFGFNHGQPQATAQPFVPPPLVGSVANVPPPPHRTHR